jgi:hypothetical protein
VRACTASTVWQKKHVTPRSFDGSSARFWPSVVAPSWTAMGAWQFTQKVPSCPFVSRCPRLFIATKTGSSDA